MKSKKLICIVGVFAFDVSNYRYMNFKIKYFFCEGNKKFSSIKIKVLEIFRYLTKVLPK